jgi:hypothetical protein
MMMPSQLLLQHIGSLQLLSPEVVKLLFSEMIKLLLTSTYEWQAESLDVAKILKRF